MTMRAACFAAVCLALSAPLAHAATADPVVKAQLESKGTPFTIDDDGDFQITVRIDDERTQLGFRSLLQSAFAQPDEQPQARTLLLVPLLGNQRAGGEQQDHSSDCRHA